MDFPTVIAVTMTATVMVIVTGTVTGTATGTATATASVTAIGTEAARTTEERDTMRMMHTMTHAPREDTEFPPHKRISSHSVLSTVYWWVFLMNFPVTSHRPLRQWVRQGQQLFKSHASRLGHYLQQSRRYASSSYTGNDVLDPPGCHQYLIHGTAVYFLRRVDVHGTSGRNPLMFSFPYSVLCFLACLFTLLLFSSSFSRVCTALLRGKYVL
ncbi:hypothetical protein BDV25DRAFT_63898 [Aspergillus avenaceus]|uniref:Uncharacterized protein n=1 Tax=Aspergillus avenaceus TaxID=36643 RepID=A0A5N6U8L9_ASPAV|nr:hypothetical protein BDV25DRAFT_63898 [Aspergillus avenaceus]